MSLLALANEGGTEARRIADSSLWASRISVRVFERHAGGLGWLPAAQVAFALAALAVRALIGPAIAVR